MCLCLCMCLETRREVVVHLLAARSGLYVRDLRQHTARRGGSMFPSLQKRIRSFTSRSGLNGMIELHWRACEQGVGTPEMLLALT